MGTCSCVSISEKKEKYKVSSSEEANKLLEELTMKVVLLTADGKYHKVIDPPPEIITDSLIVQKPRKKVVYVRKQIKNLLKDKLSIIYEEPIEENNMFASMSHQNYYLTESEINIIVLSQKKNDDNITIRTQEGWFVPLDQEIYGYNKILQSIRVNSAKKNKKISISQIKDPEILKIENKKNQRIIENNTDISICDEDISLDEKSISVSFESLEEKD